MKKQIKPGEMLGFYLGAISIFITISSIFGFSNSIARLWNIIIALFLGVLGFAVTVPKLRENGIVIKASLITSIFAVILSILNLALWAAIR